MAQPNREQRRKAQAAQTRTPDSVEAIYTKSNACRVIHVDGAYGGVTPQLNIYMALYSEHNALPSAAVYVLDRAEKVAREQIQTPSNQWVREIETEVLMSREMARSLRDWLDGRLAIADKLESDQGVTFATRSEDTGVRNADAS